MTRLHLVGKLQRYTGWAKKVDFWDLKMYCSKNNPSGGNFMRESIPRILEP
jgi:hypothetical protein